MAKVEAERVEYMSNIVLGALLLLITSTAFSWYWMEDETLLQSALWAAGMLTLFGGIMLALALLSGEVKL